MVLLHVLLSAFSVVSTTWAMDLNSMIQARTHRRGWEADDPNGAKALEPFGGSKAVMAQFMQAMAAARQATRHAGEELKHEEVSFVDNDDGPRQQVMYGVFTTSVPAYRKRLEAVMNTWGARPKAKGLFYSVAGRSYPSEWQEPGIVVGAEDCEDGVYGNSCKEASLIAEAARRNASWLVITGEDNYVDTARLEAALRGKDPTVPVAMGCLGCGTGLSMYGELVAKNGGLCGGCGEVLSQGALQMLAAHGRSALIEEYGRETQCDMSTSKALRERDIPLNNFPGELSGNPIFSQKQIEQSTGVVIFHYVMPAAMRWIHALRTGSDQDQDAELLAFEAAAFKEGCMRGFQSNHWFRPRVQECRDKFTKSIR